MNFLVVIFALLATGACWQKITVYDEKDQKGNFNYNEETTTANLGWRGWNKRIVSVKVTGIQVLYDQTYFGASDPYRGVFVVWGDGARFNLGNFAKKASSARQVGNFWNWKADRIVLYKKDAYQGKEMVIYDGDVNDLLVWAKITKSLIITGSSPWTVFDSKGERLCLYPRKNGSPGLFRNETYLKRMYQAITRFRKGCHTGIPAYGE